MRFKVLVFKNNPILEPYLASEFEGEIYSTNIPKLYGEDSTIEGLQEYYDKHTSYKLDLSDIEFKDVELKFI